jgi:hypothetical protein
MVKLKISILPDVEVGVGAIAPNQRIDTPDPFTFSVEGMKPVPPCVTNPVTVNVRPFVVGAFVMFQVMAPPGVLVIQNTDPKL